MVVLGLQKGAEMETPAPDTGTSLGETFPRQPVCCQGGIDPSACPEICYCFSLMNGPTWDCSLRTKSKLAL